MANLGIKKIEKNPKAFSFEDFKLKSQVSSTLQCNTVLGVFVKIKYIIYLTKKYGNNWEYNHK